MIRPDAIPVVSLKSVATLAPRDANTLFGATPPKHATADVVWAGETLAAIAVGPGAQTRVTWSRLEHPERNVGLRLTGPLGSCPLENEALVENRLVVPERLARAWNLPERVTLLSGGVAFSVPVRHGDAARCEIDEALYLAAGRPDHARWMPDLALTEHLQTGAPSANNPSRRIVTENDVWQARLRKAKIAIRPGQIVTPAARTLGNEWGIFE